MKIFAILVGLGTFIDLPLPVRISLAEALLMLALPLLWANRPGVIMNKTIVTMIVLSAAYIASVLVSDIRSEFHFQIFFRSVARPVFVTYLMIAYTLILVKRPWLVLYMTIGSLLGACIAVRFQTKFDIGMNSQTDYSFFVFKIQPIVAAFVSLAAYFSYRRSHLFTLALYIAGALVVGIFGSRASALVYLIAFTCFLFFPGSNAFSPRIELLRQSIRRYRYRLIVAMTLGSLIGFMIYTYLAPRGYLGDYAQAKYRQQTASQFGATPWGLLLAGRTDALISVLMIRDNPVLGHGTSALAEEYGLNAADLLGWRLSPSELREISTYKIGHSIFLGAWAQSGFLAALFWLVVLIFATRLAILAIVIRSDLAPLLALIYLQFLWAFMFSPLSIDGRSSAGLLVALCAIFADRQRPLLSIQQLRHSLTNFHPARVMPAGYFQPAMRR